MRSIIFVATARETCSMLIEFLKLMVTVGVGGDDVVLLVSQLSIFPSWLTLLRKEEAFVLHFEADDVVWIE